MDEIDIFLEELRQRAKSKSFEEYAERLKFAYRVDKECDELIKEDFTKAKFLETKFEGRRTTESIESLEGDFLLTKNDVQLRVFLMLSKEIGKLDADNVRKFLDCFALFPQTAGIICVWDTEILHSGFGNFYQFQALSVEKKRERLRLPSILSFKDAVKACYEKQVKSWKIPELKKVYPGKIPNTETLLKRYLRDKRDQLSPDSLIIPEKKEAYSRFLAEINFERIIEIANKINSSKLKQEEIEKLIDEIFVKVKND